MRGVLAQRLGEPTQETQKGTVLRAQGKAHVRFLDALQELP